MALLVRGERGRRICVKVMLCGCGCRLEASGDDGLVRETLAHRRQEHEVSVADEELVRQAVQKNAYRLEHATPYANGDGPDEEFGPEPY